MIASVPYGTLVFIFIMGDCIVFLDGAYISLISKHIGNKKHLNLDLKEFSLNLAKKQKLWYKEIYYYTCPPFQSNPPTNEETKRKAGYDKFIAKIKNIGINVREGRLQKINEEFSQKGVDNLITIDLMKKANFGIKNFILVTCDTDFVPVIKEVQKSYGVNVIIYYYKDKENKSKFSMSDHILSVCDKKIRLRKEDFERAKF